MAITPIIAGRGMAGQAMQRALALLAVIHPELRVLPPVFAPRGQALGAALEGADNPVLFVATPHALHAPLILEGAGAGCRAIVVDKPVCVSQEQISMLQGISTPVAVCHGYRMMWGPQLLRTMLLQGDLGDLICIEGRYWQSSAAQRALDPNPPPVQLWKNDPKLSGQFDALLDLGSHWIDLVFFLIGEQASKSRGWISHINAEAEHRDTHVHLDMTFSSSRTARASISKTAHGAANDLEVIVLGSRKSVRWNFAHPDVLKVGSGGTTSTFCRGASALGSGQRPFHGLGWLEGYLEVIKQTLLGLEGRQTAPVPTLAEGINVMRTIFETRFER